MENVATGTTPFTPSIQEWKFEENNMEHVIKRMSDSHFLNVSPLELSRSWFPKPWEELHVIHAIHVDIENNKWMDHTTYLT